MSHKILITSADGQTGHLTAELLLTEESFKSKFSSLILLASDPSKCGDLKEHGQVEIKPINYAALLGANSEQSLNDLSEMISGTGADTLFLIPPAHKDKLAITTALIDAAKSCEVMRVLLLSSAGCDLAERDKQPRMREFVEIEKRFMQCKGEEDTGMGHSPAIIRCVLLGFLGLEGVELMGCADGRAGYYAENLLLCNTKIQESGTLPLPIGKNHKFAPVALGDVAYLAAMILTSDGPHGFSDDVRFVPPSPITPIWSHKLNHPLL